MPQSHICPSCLTELARIRAIPDRHYNLPIVVCPKCKLSCVRTKHPDQAFWREIRQLIRSIRLLIITILVTLLAGWALAGMSFAMEPVLTDRRGNLLKLSSIDLDDTYLLLAAICFVLLGSCAVRVAYAHQRLWVAWLMLMIPSTIFVSLDWLVGWGMNRVRKMMDINPNLEVPSNLEVLGRSKAFLLLAIVASVGMLLGVFLNRMIQSSSRKRVSKIRRKIKKRRVKQY